MKVRYQGRHTGGVDIVGVDRLVMVGDVVDVPDEVAALLLLQGDQWASVEEAKPVKTKAVKAEED